MQGLQPPLPLPKACCLRTTPRALPNTLDGTQERCGGGGRQLELTGRDLDAHTNPTGLSAASLVHDCRGLRSCACAAARPLTLTPES